MTAIDSSSASLEGVIQERSAEVRVCICYICNTVVRYAIQYSCSIQTRATKSRRFSLIPKCNKHTGVGRRRRKSSARQPRTIQILNDLSHLSGKEHIDLVGVVV
jgi:hypothetical protein